MNIYKSNKMHRILILGSSGLIGSHLFKKIKNMDVIGTFQNEKVCEGSNFIRISIPKDLNKLENLIKKKRPSIVINTIGYSNVDFCEENQKKAKILNVDFVQSISNICNKEKIKIIHFSTDYVFDGLKNKYDELDHKNPLNYYGMTKKISEEIILKNSNNCVIRTAFVYGMSSNMRFFNYVLNKLKQGEKIHVYSNSKFTPTLIDDLINGVIIIIEKNLKGLYHITGPNCINKIDFIKLIANELKINKNLIQIVHEKENQNIAKRPDSSCLNNDKIIKEGLILSTLIDGIKKCV